MGCNTNNKIKPIDPKKKLTPEQKRLVNETVKALIVNNGNKSATARMLKISFVGLYKRIKRYPIIMKRVNDTLDIDADIAKLKIKNDVITSAEYLLKLRDAKSEQVQLQAVIKSLALAGLVEPKTNNNIQVNVLNNLDKQKDDYNL